jgi:hypothetical protein
MQRQNNNHENTKDGKHEKGREGGQNQEWSDGVLGQNHYSSAPILHYSKVSNA